MNKQEAADFLGVSPRALMRYVQAGRLAVRYERGKNGQVAMYEEGDVERLKEELSRPVFRGTISENVATIDVSPERNEGDLLPIPMSAAADALARLGPADPSKRFLLLTEIAAKPLLRVRETVMLTGLPESVIKEAIKSGSLKAVRISRTWRIRKKDLDSYLDSLFEEAV